MSDTLQVHILNQDTALKELLPLIYALSGVLFGVILGIIRDWYKVSKKFKETKKYFFYSLYMLKVAIDKQVINYDKYISVLSSKNNESPTFELYPGFSLRAVNVVTNEDLFKIFHEKNKKYKNSIFDLSNLVNSFEVIQSVVESAERETQYIHESIDSRLSKFNTLFNKLRDIIYNLQLFDRTPETPAMNDLIDEINDLGNEFQDWKDDNKKDDIKITIYEHVEHLILPLKKIVAKYNYVQMLGYILDIEQTIFELDTNKNNFCKKVSIDKENLINMKSHIIKLLKINIESLDDRIKENDVDLK